MGSRLWFICRRLGPAESKPAATQATGFGGFMGGSVERVVMTGRIEMEQPGQAGTGEQLVYTASDGTFVLTGTAAALAEGYGRGAGYGDGCVFAIPLGR